MTRNNTLLLVLAVIGLIAVTATASAYLTKENLGPEDNTAQISDTKTEVKTYNTSKRVNHANRDEITWNNTQPAAGNPAPAPARSRCTDHNVIGTVVGAAAGGLIGHQIGSGSGNTAATVGGALGGAYLGNRYVPTRDALCP